MRATNEERKQPGYHGIKGKLCCKVYRLVAMPHWQYHQLKNQKLLQCVGAAHSENNHEVTKEFKTGLSTQTPVNCAPADGCTILTNEVIAHDVSSHQMSLDSEFDASLGVQKPVLKVDDVMELVPPPEMQSDVQLIMSPSNVDDQSPASDSYLGVLRPVHGNNPEEPKPAPSCSSDWDDTAYCSEIMDEQFLLDEEISTGNSSEPGSLDHGRGILLFSHKPTVKSPASCDTDSFEFYSSKSLLNEDISNVDLSNPMAAHKNSVIINTEVHEKGSENAVTAAGKGSSVIDKSLLHPHYGGPFRHRVRRRSRRESSCSDDGSGRSEDDELSRLMHKDDGRWRVIDSDKVYALHLTAAEAAMCRGRTRSRSRSPNPVQNHRDEEQVTMESTASTERSTIKEPPAVSHHGRPLIVLDDEKLLKCQTPTNQSSDDEACGASPPPLTNRLIVDPSDHFLIARHSPVPQYDDDDDDDGDNVCRSRSSECTNPLLKCWENEQFDDNFSNLSTCGSQSYQGSISDFGSEFGIEVQLVRDESEDSSIERSHLALEKTGIDDSHESLTLPPEDASDLGDREPCPEPQSQGGTSSSTNEVYS